MCLIFELKLIGGTCAGLVRRWLSIVIGVVEGDTLG